MSFDREPGRLPAHGERRPRVAITLGDPNGIGPEVVLRCLADPRMLNHLQPVLVGSAHVLRAHAKALGFQDLRFEVVEKLPQGPTDGVVLVLDVESGRKTEVEFGRITEQAGRLSMLAVERATDLCLSGEADAMVTAPISKEAISMAGYGDPGHTEFIARRAGNDRFTMMMVSETMRVGLVTGHIPIWDVPRGVTEEAILEKLAVINGSLIRDFAIQRPRVAVLGLNPHAGDGGVLGREEQEVITPAIQQACGAGLLAFGPYPADGFFAIGGYRAYDAVLAMYHDQGLIPFKTIAFETGVNFTAGLRIVRTSPDHGTAFNLAGKGQATPDSMRSAIFTAVDVARRRAAYVEPRDYA